jgi:gamma-D-glutamyl-L-lysine dipeptidyl-peptidase
MKTENWLILFKKFGLIPVTLLILSTCRNAGIPELQTEINRIATRWVPDHRLGICNIILRPGHSGIDILSGETTKPEAKNEIINTLNNKGIKLSDSVLILPDTVKNIKYRGVVTLSVINLRKEPDHASELVSQATLGTPVLILKSLNSWIMIQTPDNYISWTEESSVTQMSNREMAEWISAPKVIYLDNSGWIYDTTSVPSGVVGDLTGGCIMKTIGEHKGFVNVMLPDGRRGYVEKKKVMDFNNWRNVVKCTEESITQTAKTFMGVPYLWGGSSAKGVDCSGFVQSVFFRNGVILQRDASLQAMHGITVDISHGFSNLRSGDLLFFGSKENGVSHVTHVAIYLGNNEYINSSGRVMTNSLDPEDINYNSKRINSLLSARRIIGTENDSGIVRVINHPWY